MKRQSKQFKVSIRGVLCVSLLIVGISTFSSMRANAATISFDPPSYSSLIPHDPIYITSDSGFEVFPGSGTVEDPYFIEGYNITTTDDNGIYIRDTTKYFIVRNCYVDANQYGISISYVADGTVAIANNTCNNNKYGIKLQSSYHSTVANNMCNNNDINGIFLRSSNMTVVNNTCNNNWDGIYLEVSSSVTVTNNTCSNNNNYGIWIDSSGNSTVVNNMCSNNSHYGIRFDNSGSSTVANNTCSNNYNGIYLYHSSNSTVANNTCSNNDINGIFLLSSNMTVVNNTCNNNNNYGICFSGSAFCVVTYNLIQENENYGLYIVSDSDNNLVHHNTFVDNNLGGTSQACDYCTNNTWYDSATLEGNYWSDWSGIGAYSIYGSAGSADLYPLDEPTLPPIIAEYNSLSLFTLLIPVVLTPFILMLSRKRRKID